MKKIILLLSIILLVGAGCSYKVVKVEDEKDKQIKDLQAQVENLKNTPTTTSEAKDKPHVVEKNIIKETHMAKIDPILVQNPEQTLTPTSNQSQTPTTTSDPIAVKIDNSKELSAIESVKSKILTGIKQMADAARYSGEGQNYLSSKNYAGASVKYSNAIETYKLANSTFLGIDKTPINCCASLIDKTIENLLQTVSYAKQSCELEKMISEGQTSMEATPAVIDAIKKAQEYFQKAEISNKSLESELEKRTLELK